VSDSNIPDVISQFVALMQGALPALPFIVILAAFALAAFAIHHSKTPGGK